MTSLYSARCMSSRPRSSGGAELNGSFSLYTYRTARRASAHAKQVSQARPGARRLPPSLPNSTQTPL
eukprot:47296-Chlamydomonas_euryale.AAC.1